MKVTIEIDDYQAARLREAAYEGQYECLLDLVSQVERAQREAIVAKASGKKPGEGPWEIHPYAARLKESEHGQT